MVDIHNHTLYEVDDGAKSKEESLAMLQMAADQGVDAIVLTPHYRHGMFGFPKEEIEAHYRELLAPAERMGISLYLGCEFHVNSRIVEYMSSGRCLTLAGSDYILTEYDFTTEYDYIYDQTKMLLSSGYLPVIAHVERYGCLLEDPQLCRELSHTGALIQINADSVLGIDGKVPEKFCKKLLKNQWADIVASDAHGVKQRASHMGKCYTSVAKKYGEDYADLLFEETPRRIISTK